MCYTFVPAKLSQDILVPEVPATRRPASGKSPQSCGFSSGVRDRPRRPHGVRFAFVISERVSTRPLAVAGCPSSANSDGASFSRTRHRARCREVKGDMTIKSGTAFILRLGILLLCLTAPQLAFAQDPPKPADPAPDPDKVTLNFFKGTEVGGLVDTYYLWNSTKVAPLFHSFDS